ncbi:MBOAT family O-acyltransferase [Trinickia caryophylli]|uniref:Probable alginate O-acetylase AlgI n=1 Tax=Trinickia caryophylli TaxID=28094 RepID=A0A1X7F2B1_TRICW|nr:MBOAT family O-acyltransferase [Trinickia caryophylli]PMS10375.1 MBOAT family protein [Trinickia caryophylli]TRX19501.1 MBOAT family protein [Trinickia caryophylli]WQE13189.1 MBOAT family O-acyltransferase [Trinickia caryophylli]SMF44610.1 D-alanyl-lipoteichoic acid acyltransferase DltB, MBOAT superfamily [Trinickia caryophylli]GLU34503.1 alginate O-acetyltransferase [Trinickia caryophylli]
MLFNSYLFLFLFLPVALAGHYAAARLDRRLAALWLCLMSFAFYGWWNPQFVALLAASIAFNFAASRIVMRCEGHPRWQGFVVGASIAADLAVLLHYKYVAALFNFLAGLGFAHAAPDTPILPLGISFFTFTQIGYLLDCRSGIVKERSLLSYVLFVTFFPHLVAGPILHHREMMPQFAQCETYRFRAENLSVGCALFAIGLAKKVLLADGVASYADAGFADPGQLGLWAAWGTSVAYALQLYFDFSGYSDMALGLAKMFGVRFPLNFNSPYKAGSIIDFWARWHITLTRYLTAYLYYPLAMVISRARERRGLPAGSGAARSPGGFAATIVVPTVFTMSLAGIWHGAGVQYLVFGLLHAGYLSVNHFWRIFVASRRPHAGRRPPASAPARGMAMHVLSVALTFAAVLVAQAFFRANGVHDAWRLIEGMLGLHGVETAAVFPSLSGLQPGDAWRLLIGHHLEALRIAVLLGIAWFAPNAHQILGAHSPALFKAQEASPPFMRWRANTPWLMATLALLLLCIANLHKEARFLYFQF